MAIGDVYEITLEGTYLLQRTINVFHYVRDGISGAPDPDLFADAFVAMFNGPVSDAIASGTGWDTLRIKDVNPSGFEFVRLGLGLSGGFSAGDLMPPFVALSFLYQRNNRTTFHGHKRFAGVGEAGQNNGLPTSSLNTLAATAAAALLSTLTASGLDYLPCIYSKVLNGVPRSTPVVNLVKDVIFKGITTQNTRKFGRGA